MEWPEIGIRFSICLGYGEDCITPAAADLIKKLLNFNHEERLGHREI